MLFAGIEGGGSFSKAVLIDESGQELTWADGGSTNYLLMGEEETRQRIKQLIDEICTKAGIGDTKLTAIGLCLSGCERDDENIRFANSILEQWPDLAESCFAASDTIGSILTVSPSGGGVLIAGTGSNSILMNPDGQVYQCGGWGHLLGDEGAAYSVARRAVKTVIDAEQNFVPCEYSIEAVRAEICDYFKVKDMFGLLDPMYVSFKKSHFAGLCAKLSIVANNGDPLARQLFRLAGNELGRHITAWLDKVDDSLLQEAGGLKIACVGSVFKSWPLMREGFFDVLNGKSLKELTLLKLVKASAFGAAMLAIQKSGHQDLVQQIDLTKNYEVLEHWIQS